MFDRSLANGPASLDPHDELNPLFLAGVFAAIAIVFASVGFLPGDDPESLRAWLVVLSGFGIIGMAAVFRIFGWKDPLDPIVFYPVLLWLLFGLVPLFGLDPQKGGITTVALLPPEQVTSTFVQVLIGIVAFMLGYIVLARPVASFTLPPSVVVRISLTATTMLVLVLNLARVGLITFGNFGYIFSTERYESTLSITGILALLAGANFYVVLLSMILGMAPSSSAKAKLLLVVTLILEIGFALLSGMKGNLIVPAFAVVVGFVYIRGRLPLRAIIASVLVFLFLVPAVERYRELLNSPGERVSSFSSAVNYGRDVADEVLEAPAFGDRLQDGYIFMLGRLDMLRAFAVIRSKTPSQIPYEAGDLYVAAPVLSFVPRFLWPEKPVLDVGARTSSDYYGVTGTATARTTMGDLHANFGPVAVVIGMFLLGFLIGGLRRFFVKRRTLLSFLFFCVGLSTLLAYETDAASILASLPREFILVALIVWFSRFTLGEGARVTSSRPVAEARHLNAPPLSATSPAQRR